MPLSGPLTIASNASALGGIDIKGDLSGVVSERNMGRAAASKESQSSSALPKSVRLKVDAALSALRIEVREFSASAGNIRAGWFGISAPPEPRLGPRHVTSRGQRI